MLITFNKKDIAEGLSKAIGIVPLKSGSSYLRSLWIEAIEDSLRIMVTDSTTEFTGTYKANVQTSGSVGVNAKAFVELIKKLPDGDITLNFNDETRILHVEQGRRSYKLPSADPTWFKPLDVFPDENAILWSGDFFQEVIDKTYFCISDDESNEQLACFYMAKTDANTIDCCGLNGHQLAVISFTNDELANLLPEKGLLLQKKYTAELRKWLNSQEIYINITENKVFLKDVNNIETLSFVRSDYTFPNHQAFLDRLKSGDLSLLTLDRKEILDSLERIQIFNSEAEKCTYFTLAENDLQLSSQGQETGSAKEHIDVEYNGSISSIAFPTRSLIEILNHYTSEKVTFTFTGTETPCGISGEHDLDYTVIIMPMKINSINVYDEE